MTASTRGDRGRFQFPKQSGPRSGIMAGWRRRRQCMGVRDLLFIGVVLGGAGTLGSGLLRSKVPPAAPGTGRAVAPPAATDDLRPVVADVDASFRRRWAENGHTATPRVEELTVLRRLALALT